MKKQILLITCLVLAVVLTVGAISANDVNVPGSYATNLVDDTSDASVPLENTADSSEISVSNDSNVDNDPSKVSLSSEEVLESDNSNSLSTNNLGNSLDTGVVSTSQVSTSLKTSNLTLYYKNGSKLTATLVDNNGKGIAGESVVMGVNGVYYKVTTDKNGVASLAIGLAPGTYTASVSYKGSGNYAPVSAIPITIKVLPTIQSKDIEKYYKGSAQYTATFLNGNGAALANTNVKITVNGVTYTKKTNAKGVASLELGLQPGSYKITAKDPVTGYSLTNNIKILSTISASDLSKVYTDAKKFTATFYDNNGKALANKNVKFVFNGNTYTIKTNGNGVAGLSITSTGPGTYKIKSVNVDGLSKTNTVKIVKTSSSKIITQAYMFVPGDTKTVKATLLNQFDYAPGAGKTVTLTVGGKTFTGTTDGNGVVSFNLASSLSKGSYTATYKFAGNSFYTASSASNSIVILDSKQSKLTVKSDSTFGKGAGTEFKVELTAGGVPLEKRTVYMTVNGITYPKTTDSKGIASLPINLGVGNYEISYSFRGESKIDSTSGKTTITVDSRTKTSLTWKSGTSFNQGSQTIKILLLDSNNKALSGKKVVLNDGTKDYNVKTDSSGYATFTTNIPLGSNSIQYSFGGDNSYMPSSGSKTVKINLNTKGNGYWVFGGDMKNVDLSALAAKGTSDIFLNYYAFTKWGKSDVESWIAEANKKGIRVHIWMQTFKKDDSWINPVTQSSKLPAIIEEAKYYASVKGVSGVHLDYVRYPGTNQNAAHDTNGGTKAISNFVKNAADAIHSVNPNCIVSVAVMPETTNNVYYYGQDMAEISKYVDVVIPMVYKGNYKKTTSWITTTAKWFVDNSNGAEVWVGLQAYKSDDDYTKLSTSEITKDCQAALSSKASGVILFRWGYTNFVDFNNLPTSTVSVSMNSIISGAKTIKAYYESKGELPDSVKLTEGTFTMPEFLYLMSKAIVQLGNSKTGAIDAIIGVQDASSTTPANINSQQLLKADYLDLANRVANYISNNNQAPSYASSTVGNIVYTELVDSFSRIIAFYSNNDKYMPNYVTIKQGSGSYPTSITELAKLLTKGLTTDKEKANALFVWVRDNIAYSFYYNTQKGAEGTLIAKSGNCCDQAQLLVALARASGLTARFATGNCKFSSGSTYGHVWVQIKVSGSWHALDPTSSRNTYDSINNWNTASYTDRGTYDVLPY